MQTDVLAEQKALALENGILIRTFTTVDELVRQMRDGLAAGKYVLFVPGLRSCRHFFNSDGFVASMTEVAASIGSHKIVVPAALYGKEMAFGVRPADGA